VEAGGGDAPALLQRLQAIERRQHLFAVVDEARQPSLAQRAAEVAGVARDHDLLAVKLDVTDPADAQAAARAAVERRRRA
jgi:NAD(P)-dependent dehydrogenase (short-subunit alcohol dehydrogenase family)